MNMIRFLFVSVFAMLLSIQANYCHASSFSTNEGEPDATYRATILKLSDAAELDSLEDEGVRILRHRGNLALALFPTNTTRTSPENRNTRPRGRKIYPTMDMARIKYDAFRVTEGTDLTRGYTGKGVVVGICDIGFDPLHPSFRSADGKSRISKLIQYKESAGVRLEMNSEDEYERWITDNVEEYHATHVAGILAGSYFDNGYQGIATDAEMVVSTSELTDVGLLAGVEDIIEYAKSVGKPAVVNLSMGSYNGPHDGTSLFSQYLDMLGEEAIICLSAGNEGKSTISLPFDFSYNKLSIKSRIGNTSWNLQDLYGMTDVWCADDSRICIRPFIFDEYTKTEVLSFPELSPENEELTAFTSAATADFPNAMIIPEMAKYLKGHFLVYGGLDPNVEVNRRYRLNLEYDLLCPTISPGGPWGRYTLAFEVSGDEGTHIDIYADGQYSRLMGYYNEPIPGSSASLSDIACGNNIISVGMYGNRFDYPLIDGTKGFSGFEPNMIIPHSSYGTLIDGRVMPLTVAPGYLIVSGMSSPYLEKHAWMRDECSAMATVDGSDAYWVTKGGTSMSCPYVAGFLATWLEADPTLTVDKVKDIILRTNMHDYPEPDNPRHGRGWFNPYAGLLQVLEGAGVDNVYGDVNSCRISYDRNNSRARIECADDTEVVWNLVSAAGIQLKSGNSTGSAEVSLSDFPSGLFILKATVKKSAPKSLRILK